MEEDSVKWYTDIVKKVELIDYSSVKVCAVIQPYGYAIIGECPSSIQSNKGR